MRLRLADTGHGPAVGAAELRARVLSRREDEVTVQLPSPNLRHGLHPSLQPWGAVWSRSGGSSGMGGGGPGADAPALRVHAKLELDRAALSLMHAALKVKRATSHYKQALESKHSHLTQHTHARARMRKYVHSRQRFQRCQRARARALWRNGRRWRPRLRQNPLAARLLTTTPTP